MNQKTNLQELDTRTNYMCNYMCLTKKKKERKNKHEDKIQTILEIESQAPCLSNPGLRVSHYVSEKKNPHKFHLNPSRTKKKNLKGTRPAFQVSSLRLFLFHGRYTRSRSGLAI